MRTNPKIREIVDTILELAYMPPNRALTCGKVFVSISNCPEAETYLSNKTVVVKICGVYGWSFEFTVSIENLFFIPNNATIITLAKQLYNTRLGAQKNVSTFKMQLIEPKGYYPWHHHAFQRGVGR